LTEPDSTSPSTVPSLQSPSKPGSNGSGGQMSPNRRQPGSGTQK
jgi:hypothetical protein